MLFRLKRIFRTLSCDNNWNIGFLSLTPEELIKNRGLNSASIHWMKHGFKDRFFADPFILNSDDNTITVLAEESMFENPKGIIVELIIDKKRFELQHRRVILDTSTHLSYPAIINIDNQTYVYPENGDSGKLNIYKYSETEPLSNRKTILNEAVADSTIIKYHNSYYIIATRYPNTQEQAFLYKSHHPFSNFKIVQPSPIQIKRSCSRPAGNWFSVGNTIFRPAQDCTQRYGEGIRIMKISSFSPYLEDEVFKISPESFKYNRGIHTINFSYKLCVIDGYGYRYPIIGRILHTVKLICRLIK